MKKLLLLQIILLLFIGNAKAQEISLFDKDGNPVAYIDSNDEDLTIYMWKGEPVAYLTTSSSDSFNIYGFNGKHLGWFEDGIVWNHEGYIVGFQKGAISKYTYYEPYKSYKSYKPFPSFKEYAPYKPYFHSSFANEYLSLFLMRGAK